MSHALTQIVSAAAPGVALVACAAPPGYWGTANTPPASASFGWQAIAAFPDTPRVDYPGPATYGNTPDGGRPDDQ